MTENTHPATDVPEGDAAPVEERYQCVLVRASHRDEVEQLVAQLEYADERMSDEDQ